MKLGSFFMLLDEVYDGGDVYNGGLYIHRESAAKRSYRNWALSELRNHLKRYLPDSVELNPDHLLKETDNFLVIMKRCKRHTPDSLNSQMFEEAIDVTLDVKDLIRCCMPK